MACTSAVNLLAPGVPAGSILMDSRQGRRSYYVLRHMAVLDGDGTISGGALIELGDGAARVWPQAADPSILGSPY